MKTALLYVSLWILALPAWPTRKMWLEKYLGTSDRKELEAMLSDWEAFKQVGIDLQKDTNGEVFMFTGLSSVKYIIDGQNSTPIVSDDKLDLENFRSQHLRFYG